MDIFKQESFIILSICVWPKNIDLFIYKARLLKVLKGCIWPSDDIKERLELFFNHSFVPGVLPSTLHVSSHILIRKQKLWGAGLPQYHTASEGRLGFQSRCHITEGISRWTWALLRSSFVLFSVIKSINWVDDQYYQGVKDTKVEEEALVNWALPVAFFFWWGVEEFLYLLSLYSSDFFF